MARYSDISYGQFGGGVDQLSPESRIPDGYVQELVNIDPTPEGSLVKRKGTQLYGTIPVRVNKIEYFRTYPDATQYDNAASYNEGDIVTYNDAYYSAPEGGIAAGGTVPGNAGSEWLDFNDFSGELCFYLDSTVDVLTLKETPIYVYGRTSDCQAAGDFSDEDTGVYYPKFVTDLRKKAAAEVSNSLTLEGLSHGQGVYQSPLLALSTSSDNLSNEQIIADSYTISELTADLEVGVSSSLDISTFLVTKSRAAQPGNSYVHTELLPAQEDNTFEMQMFSIAPSVHGLDNFNILVDCYIDTGTELEKIFPHEYVIQANGRVDVYFQNYQQLNLVVLLASTDAANVSARTISDGDDSYTIENLSTPFPYVQAFEELSGGIRKSVFFNSTQVDTILSRATLSLTNQGPTIATSIIWEYASLVSNKLCVEASDPVVDDFSVKIPGLEHGLGSAVAMELRYSTNSTNTNNYIIQADNSFLDTALNDVTINLNNYTTKSFNVYGVLANRGGENVQVETRVFSSEEYTAPNAIAWTINVDAGFDIKKVNLDLFELYEDELGNIQRREAQIFDNTLIDELSREVIIFIHIEENADGSTRQIELEARIFEADVRATEAQIGALTSSGLVAAGLTSSFPMAKIYRTLAAFTIEWNAASAAAGDYDTNALVMYEDILYRSTTNNNGATPGTVGSNWTALPIFTYDLQEPIEEGYTQWAVGTTYAPGAVVINSGYYYIAKQSNTGRTPLAAASDAYWLYLPTVERRVILADSVSIDSLSSTITVVVNNAFAFPITITSIWDYADYVTELFCVPVTGTGLDGYTDEAPQMTIYGLPHSQLYASSAGNTPGHVTHVDVYRAEAEERAVAGLGGNIFAAFERSEVGEALGLSTYYPDLRSRVDSSAIGLSQIIVGPVFTTTSATANRTAGVVRASNTQGGTLRITKAEYVSGTNVKYTISTPQRQLTEGKGIGDIITTNDYLTIENMGYSVHNGTFQVVSVAIADTYDPTTLALLEEAITITVSNPDASSSDFNQTSAGGRAGIFTDSIPLSGPCNFLPGDRILSSAWGGEQFLSAITSSSYIATGETYGILRIDGLFREISLPDGLVLVGQRTSRIVPLRTANNVPTTKNIVAGDVLNYSEVARELRAKYIIAKNNQTIKVLVNLGQAFASIDEDITTDWMSVGQNILLLDEGVFRGEYSISGIFDQLSFTFTTTANNNQVSSGATLNVENSAIDWTGHGLAVGDPLIFVSPTPNITGIDKDTIYFVANSASYTENSFQITSVRGGQPITLTGLPTGTAVSIQYSSTTTLIGNCIEVDEGLSWEDSVTSVTTFSVARRWIPVEAPVSGYDQPPSTYYRHLNANTYDNQLPLRSTMVNDTMFFTNGEDAVQRYDGVNITRAGLIRWQPHLYLTVDTTDGSIKADSPEIEGTDLQGLDASVFDVKKGTELAFYVGQRIAYERIPDGESELTTTFGTIAAIDSTGTSSSFIRVNFILGNNDIIEDVATAQKLIGVTTYRYYYKLNLIDANSNRIVSAVTGAEDAVIDIVGTSNIRHLLVRPPFLDNFDFARLEIEVYRTKKDTQGPYYRVAKLFPEWNSPGDAYLEFVDRLNDINLESQDPMTFQQGQELGQTWTGPLRAKYITSASNSLVLANVKDWPKISIDIEASPTAIISSSSFEGRRWLLRKSNLDTGTDTNNIDRMGFEFTIDEAIHLTDISSIDVNNEENEIAIASTAHGLEVGDWVYLFHYDEADIVNVNPRLGGHYQVVGTTTDAFYIKVSNKLLQSLALSSYAATDVNKYAVATNPKDIPIWLGLDRLYGTRTGVDQTRIPAAFSAFLRSANAVNSAQAACTTEGFKPWVVANAGGEFVNAGIVFETPYATDTTLEIVLPGFTDFIVLANDVRRAGNEQVQARTRVFPSRILVSYAQYPELFDSPTVPLDTDSLSAIDINPADGQQITGVIPFFGESAFGSAQKDGVLLVFKTASVYIVNINSKRNGQNSVTKIDTRGLGCTAPYSIAPTQNGIMFANKSGIYRITSNYQCQYIGRRLERTWQEKVDTDSLDTTMFGHYYPLGNQYKLSVPYEEDGLDTPNRTLVYNTTREYTGNGDGSWTTYSNIPAIGWANMLSRPLIATPEGTVLTLRDTGESTDYRDGDAPIVAMAILRALDFGSGSVRKAIGTVNIEFKPDENSDNNPVVESAVDLVNQWEPLDLATVSRRKGVGNVSTRVTQQLSVIQFTADRRKGLFFQLRISNSVIDEGLHVAGISLMVKGLSNTAIQQAKSTRA